MHERQEVAAHERAYENPAKFKSAIISQPLCLIVSCAPLWASLESRTVHKSSEAPRQGASQTSASSDFERLRRSWNRLRTGFPRQAFVYGDCRSSCGSEITLVIRRCCGLMCMRRESTARLSKSNISRTAEESAFSWSLYFPRTNV